MNKTVLEHMDHTDLNTQQEHIQQNQWLHVKTLYRIQSCTIVGPSRTYGTVLHWFSWVFTGLWSQTA